MMLWPTGSVQVQRAGASGSSGKELTVAVQGCGASAAGLASVAASVVTAAGVAVSKGSLLTGKERGRTFSKVILI